MTWCDCEIPALKEDRFKLRRDERCLKCGNRIRKYYKTKSGNVLVLRKAETFHECQRCGSPIERGDTYYGMVVPDDWGRRHTWALCTGCYRKQT